MALLAAGDWFHGLKHQQSDKAARLTAAMELVPTIPEADIERYVAATEQSHLQSHPDQRPGQCRAPEDKYMIVGEPARQPHPIPEKKTPWYLKEAEIHPQHEASGRYKLRDDRPVSYWDVHHMHLEGGSEEGEHANNIM